MVEIKLILVLYLIATVISYSFSKISKESDIGLLKSIFYVNWCLTLILVIVL